MHIYKAKLLLHVTHICQWLLLVYVRYFLVNITSGGEITFLSVSSDIEVGRDNLVSSVEVSCTVAIDGQFSWSWTGPNGAALDVSRTSVLTADLTCTSILKIRNLSLSDGGQYTCTASLSDGSINYPQTARSSTVGINTEGNFCQIHRSVFSLAAGVHN